MEPWPNHFRPAITPSPSSARPSARSRKTSHSVRYRPNNATRMEELFEMPPMTSRSSQAPVMCSYDASRGTGFELLEAASLQSAIHPVADPPAAARHAALKRGKPHGLGCGLGCDLRCDLARRADEAVWALEPLARAGRSVSSSQSPSVEGVAPRNTPVDSSRYASTLRDARARTTTPAASSPQSSSPSRLSDLQIRRPEQIGTHGTETIVQSMDAYARSLFE